MFTCPGLCSGGASVERIKNEARALKSTPLNEPVRTVRPSSTPRKLVGSAGPQSSLLAGECRRVATNFPQLTWARLTRRIQCPGMHSIILGHCYLVPDGGLHSSPAHQQRFTSQRESCQYRPCPEPAQESRSWCLSRLAIRIQLLQCSRRETSDNIL